MGAQRAGAPVLTGSVPPLAPFYHARQETGFELADAPAPGRDDPARACACSGQRRDRQDPARGRVRARHVVGAGCRPAGLGSRGQPERDHRRLRAGGRRPGAAVAEETAVSTADTAAQRFLDWLRTTGRRWAVVLDDVASPVDIDGLWPQGPAGQVVVTSRLRESELAWTGASVTAHAVAGFSRREALAYLNARLTGFPDQRIEALDLAEDLGGLPIALAQAAAVVTVTGSTCRDYRAEYAERLRATAGTVVDGCPPSLLATWSLAVEHAHELPPAGCPGPRSCFASVLDTSGIPAAVLTSPAACAYITGRPGTGGWRTAVTGGLGRGRPPSRTWCGPPTPPWTGSACSAWTAPARCAPSGCTRRCGPPSAPTWRRATSSRWWPRRPRRCLRRGPSLAPRTSSPQLNQALRDCAGGAARLRGRPAVEAGRPPGAAAGGDVAHRAPGARGLRHRLLAGARAPRAASCSATGTRSRCSPGTGSPTPTPAAARFAEALPVFEAALADREATFGAQHPETVTARLNVAQVAERGRAGPGGDRAVRAGAGGAGADARARAPGDAGGTGPAGRRLRGGRAARRQHPAVRAGAGRRRAGTRPGAPRHAGRPGPAWPAPTWRRASRARRSPPTSGRWSTRSARRARTTRPPLAARTSLADAYRGAGRTKEAIGAYERVLADRERVLGPDHPDTIAARGNLGYAYRSAGRLKEAIPQYERVVADRERLLPADHRDTLAARAILAPSTSRGGGCARRSPPTSGWSPTASGCSAPATSTR